MAGTSRDRNNFFSKTDEGSSSKDSENQDMKPKWRYYNCKTEHMNWLLQRDDLSKELNVSTNKSPKYPDPHYLSSGNAIDLNAKHIKAYRVELDKSFSIQYGDYFTTIPAVLPRAFVSVAPSVTAEALIYRVEFEGITRLLDEATQLRYTGGSVEDVDEARNKITRTEDNFRELLDEAFSYRFIR